MINEIKFIQNMKKSLKLWIKNNEKPNWYDWLGIYPEKSSVEAARTELKCLNSIISDC